MASVLAFVLASYAIARHFTPSLIFYVVEQSLIQKAPANVHAEMVRTHLNVILSPLPDQDARMEKLLWISQYLEKVQHLKAEEWEALFPEAKPAGTSAL